MLSFEATCALCKRWEIDEPQDPMALVPDEPEVPRPMKRARTAGPVLEDEEPDGTAEGLRGKIGDLPDAGNALDAEMKALLDSDAPPPPGRGVRI